MEIFRLFGSILINSDDADKSLKKTDEHAEKVGGTLGKGIGTAAKWGIGLVTAAGAGAAALFGMATKASEAAANIDDVAQRTNLSAKTLQEYKHAAEMSGFSMDTIEGSAKKLTKTMGNYAAGNKGTIEAFKKLGLSATGANGKLKSTDEMFPQIIAKLADMKDITERDTLSMEIFGKSAMDMGPLLNGGSKGVKELTDEAHKMGLVMSDEQVAAGAKFDDSLTLVKSSLGAMVTKIGVEVLPIVQQGLDWVTLHMPEIQAVTSMVFGAISSSINFVKDNINWLLPVLGGLLTAIMVLKVISVINGLMIAWKASTIGMAFAQGGLNAVLALNPIGLVVIGIVALITAIVLLWTNCDWFRIGIMAIFQGLKDFFFGIVIPYWQGLGGIITGVFNSIWGSVSSVIGNVKNIFSSLIDFVRNVFTGNWSGAWHNVINIFSNIFSAIATIWKTPINAMISGINGFLSGISKIKIPDWVPKIGGKGFSIPKIPSFAVGTRYLPSDMMVQAHKGEMIVPKSENPYANSGGGTLPTDNNQPKNIIIQLIADGKKLAEVVAPYSDIIQGKNIVLNGRSVGV